MSVASRVVSAALLRSPTLTSQTTKLNDTGHRPVTSSFWGGNGNRDFVATGGLLRQTPDVDTIYSDKLIRLRFNAEEVADRLVPYLWQSWEFLTRLQSKAESGSGL